MPNKIPTVLIIFGATGDLIGKKIVPALFLLFEKNKLPRMLRIVGFSRRKLSEEEFKQNVVSMLAAQNNVNFKQDKIDRFLQHFSYQRGDFNELKSYQNLARILGRIDGDWKVCSNKLFYLATPPQYNETIFRHLKTSGLTLPCSPEEGWTRVIVEKPFGNDLTTAEELDLLLGKLFREEQIYRIDHYLAKEMLQNILSFRFANNLLEESWNNKFIEKIEIRLMEKIGVEKRGAFYDGLGALRDVGQNHLLQMLALVTMDQPQTFAVEQVRNKRYELLKRLSVSQIDEIRNESVRAQYKGYRQIQGVDPDSDKETYFKIKVHLDSPRWRGVPIILESGKRAKKELKEIVITFKHTLPCLCPPGRHFNNKVVFQMEPEEKIEISFLAKRPGLDMEVTERKFNSTARVKVGKIQYVEEYEKLLLDCIEGNQLLFVSTSEIREMWRVIDPFILAWQTGLVPLQFYEPDENINFEIKRKEQPVVNRKELVIIGLGKMGKGLAGQLIEKGWKVYGFSRSADKLKQNEKEGIIPLDRLDKLTSLLSSPRIILLSLPAGEIVDEVIFGKNGLTAFLQPGDFLLDTGNSFYKDSLVRAEKLTKIGIRFLDVGISGGPAGARNGACLMVGGNKKDFDYLVPLFNDISEAEGVEFFPGYGAGHFVKMVHNGIEYGMMQAIGEGFAILKNAKFRLRLKNIASIYNKGSVIESRLIGWLTEALSEFGDDLKNVSGTARHLGEGKWTIETAKELGIEVPVIEESFNYRMKTVNKPDFIGKILTVLRHKFGGHPIK